MMGTRTTQMGVRAPAMLAIVQEQTTKESLFALRLLVGMALMPQKGVMMVILTMETGAHQYVK